MTVGYMVAEGQRIQTYQRVKNKYTLPASFINLLSSEFIQNGVKISKQQEIIMRSFGLTSLFHQAGLLELDFSESSRLYTEVLEEGDRVYGATVLRPFRFQQEQYQQFFAENLLDGSIFPDVPLSSIESHEDGSDVRYVSPEGMVEVIDSYIEQIIADIPNEFEASSTNLTQSVLELCDLASTLRASTLNANGRSITYTSHNLVTEQVEIHELRIGEVVKLRPQFDELQDSAWRSEEVEFKYESRWETIQAGTRVVAYSASMGTAVVVEKVFFVTDLATFPIQLKSFADEITGISASQLLQSVYGEATVEFASEVVKTHQITEHLLDGLTEELELQSDSTIANEESIEDPSSSNLYDQGLIVDVIPSEYFDGEQQIAYLAPDGDLMLFNSRSGITKLLDSESLPNIRGLHWSPSGEYLALQTWDTDNLPKYSLWLFGQQFSEPHLVSADTMFDSVEWHPQNEELAFLELTDDALYPESQFNSDIFIYNIYGLSLSRLTFDGGMKKTTSWSPDGKYLAYNYIKSLDAECYGQIDIVDVESSIQYELGPSNDSPLLEWSQEGDKLFYSSYAEGCEVRSYNHRIDLELIPDFIDYADIQKQVSPDGDTTVYDCNNFSDICVSNTDGLNEFVLFPGNSPRWQPKTRPFPNFFDETPVATDATQVARNVYSYNEWTYFPTNAAVVDVIADYGYVWGLNDGSAMELDVQTGEVTTYPGIRGVERDIAVSPTGSVWVATEPCYGVAMLEVDGTWHYQETINNAVPEDNCAQEIEISPQTDSSFWRVWVGTEYAGLSYSFALDQWQAYDPNLYPSWHSNADPPDRSVGSVKAMDMSADGIIWTGAWAGSLYKTIPDEGIVNYVLDIEGEIVDLGATENGGVWLISDKDGIARVDANGLLHKMDSATLPSQGVNQLVVAGDDSVWFATETGVSRLTVNNEVENYYLDEEFSDVGAMSIDADEHGNIWIGTELGFGKLENSSMSNSQSSDSQDKFMPMSYLDAIQYRENSFLSLSTEDVADCDKSVGSWICIEDVSPTNLAKGQLIETFNLSISYNFEEMSLFEKHSISNIPTGAQYSALLSLCIDGVKRVKERPWSNCVSMDNRTYSVSELGADTVTFDTAFVSPDSDLLTVNACIYAYNNQIEVDAPSFNVCHVIQMPLHSPR